MARSWLYLEWKGHQTFAKFLKTKQISDGVTSIQFHIPLSKFFVEIKLQICFIFPPSMFFILFLILIVATWRSGTIITKAQHILNSPLVYINRLLFRHSQISVVCKKKDLFFTHYMPIINRLLHFIFIQSWAECVVNLIPKSK